MTKLPTTPSFRLDGRKALVTGGGRGIGLAAATALAEAGAIPLLVSRTESEVGAASQALKEKGLQAGSAVLDVTDRDAVAELVDEHGPFQILVNNAGLARHAAFTDATEDEYDSVMNINVRSAFFVAQAVARGLKHAGLPGSIINISSQMGHVGGPKRTVYCASKHAMEGMTKAMAWELGPDNIRVNTLCPTFIETELTAPFIREPEFRAFVESKIAFGRVGQVEEIMGAVLFLASDASSLVTGSSLMVDGGWTAA
jgi:NAD(P)-dependent dehydrogenase (short-subunit alcohol dehydrogenase family)